MRKTTPVFVVHLATDGTESRRQPLAACSGLPFTPVDMAPPGTPIQLCEACRQAGVRASYSSDRDPADETPKWPCGRCGALIDYVGPACGQDAAGNLVPWCVACQAKPLPLPSQEGLW